MILGGRTPIGGECFPNVLRGPGCSYIVDICILAWTRPLNGQDAKWIGSLRGLDRNVDRIVFLIKQHDQVT